MQLQDQAPTAHTQKVTREIQGQEDPKEEYANLNLTVFFFFSSPTVRYCAFKKIKLCACIDLKEM